MTYMRLTSRQTQPVPIDLDQVKTHFILTPQGNVWRRVRPGEEEQAARVLAAAEDLEEALDKALNPNPWTSFTDIFHEAKQALYTYRHRTAVNPDPCLELNHDEVNCTDAKVHWSKWCDNCWRAAQR